MASAMFDAALVQHAIDIYMKKAYPQGPPPVVVASMLATLRQFAGDFFKAPAFVKDDPKSPRKYSLRLGNCNYPHMKLVYELGPDGKTFLFRADAHDAHCCPPADAPEHAPFRQLMETNQKIIAQIESAWADEGIPTFKSFLREDLARRQASSGARGPDAGTV